MSAPCIQCGGIVPPKSQPGGKARKFCSEACCTKWHSARYCERLRMGTAGRSPVPRKIPVYNGTAAEFSRRADMIQANPVLREALARLRRGEATREPVAAKLARLAADRSHA